VNQHEGHDVQLFVMSVTVISTIDRIDGDSIFTNPLTDHIEVGDGDNLFWCETCEEELEPADLGLPDQWKEVRHHG
jgi:hypothetical protein